MGIVDAAWVAEYRHKREAPRHPMTIPAMLVEGAMRVPGVVENLSTKGALVTNVTERPEIGTVGKLRLTHLRASLRTSGADHLQLTAQVVRHDPAGFAVVFLGGTQTLRELMHRAFARSFATLDEED